MSSFVSLFISFKTAIPHLLVEGKPKNSPQISRIHTCSAPTSKCSRANRSCCSLMASIWRRRESLPRNQPGVENFIIIYLNFLSKKERRKKKTDCNKYLSLKYKIHAISTVNDPTNKIISNI